MIYIIGKSDEIDKFLKANKARKIINFKSGISIIGIDKKIALKLNLEKIEGVTVISEEKANRFLESNINEVIHNEEIKEEL